MVRYVTSSGQTAHGGEILTELGKKQSRLLGEHLASLEFHGVILSSTRSADIETAGVIGEITGASTVPFDALDASGQNVRRDVVMAYRRVIEDYPNEDVLFICQREACEELINIFIKGRKLNARQYDCALSTFYPTKYVTPVLYDSSFIPYEETTLGERTKESFDLEYINGEFARNIELPDLSELSGERILHIGDTESFAYPYYRKLFEAVRPDVIVHTGDLADEVKIGRHPELIYEYTLKTAELLKMMHATGARIVIVIGNHDVREVVERLAPYAEIYDEGSEVILSGERCRLGHQVKNMTFDRKYCMYGHGLAGESWRNDLNVAGESCRFNVGFGSYVYDLKNERFVCIPRIFNSYN